MDILTRVNSKIDEYEDDPTDDKYMELVVLIHNLPERKKKKLLQDLMVDYQTEMYDIEFSHPDDFRKLKARLNMLLDAGIRVGILDPVWIVPPEFIMWQNQHDQKLMEQVRHIETLNRAYSKLSNRIVGSSRINVGIPGSKILPFLQVTKRIPTYRRIKEVDPRQYSTFQVKKSKSKKNKTRSKSTKRK